MRGEPEVRTVAPIEPPPPPADGVAVSSVAVKRRSRAVPILAAAVGLAVVVVAVMWLTRGGEDDDPVAVVREYFTALNAGDCEGVVGLLDTDGEPGEPDRARMVDSCRQAYEGDPATMEGVELVSARLVSREGDRATVRAELARSGEDQPSEPEIPMVRIDGEWRFDLTQTPAGPGDAVGGGTAP